MTTKTETINAINPIKKVGAFDKRVHEIDFARGALMILVLLDHILNRMMHHFAYWGPGWAEVGNFIRTFYWNGALRNVVQPLALASFCLVSGLSSGFSKNNWKRAISLVVVWGLVAGFTLLVGPLLNFSPIIFNIIAVLACSTLMYCLIQKRTWKSVLAFALIFAYISLYVLNPILCDLFVEPYSRVNVNTNSVFYNLFLPMFYPPMMISYSDYMPLFPYIVFFFVGVLGTIFIYKDKKSHIKHKFEWERPICFIGRHSLIIYLAHQAVLLPLFMLFDLFMRV